MEDIKSLLKYTVEKDASDLFLVSGSNVIIKAEGNLYPVDDDKLMPEDTEKLIKGIYEIAERKIDKYLETGDDDFSFSIKGLARFRVNSYKQRGSMAAVVRVVSFDIPDYKAIGIPESVMKVADVNGGMILVTGTAGSGKSTTQACIIDRINHTRACHIVTLEDPIEFLHKHCKSIVSQREISIDTVDYYQALRACLRQAPDVILLGEMRDAKTIQTAITAAETGHTVIATLHTNGVVNAVDRIIDAFPSTQQQQVRAQLSLVLKTVISQQLLPDINGNLVPAFEIMHTNNAIKSLIRDNKSHQIENAIASGSDEGMITMDRYILLLLKKGRIDEKTALKYADNIEQIKRNI